MSKFTRVQFVVDEFGDDPAVVTGLIGFEPASTAVGRWTSLPKQTSWFAELPEPVPDKLEDHIAALVRMLELHADGVRSVAARFHSRIEIRMDDRDWTWPHEPNGPRFGYFEVSPEVTAAASRLGLGISIHFASGVKGQKG
jgi:uncharacterized protein DUF4279